MAKIPLYRIDPETGERIEKKLDDSKAAMLPELLKRGWNRVEKPAAPAEAAPAPAAAARAVAPMTGGVSPEKEEGFLRSMEALLTGAGRGVTADFLDEIAGLAAAAGGQIGGRLAGVPSEFLAQEDFYTQGREEEQAGQKALQEESPWLTLGGQVLGTLPYAAAAPSGATTLAGRFAQAAPAAAAYGAATGVGRTDIKNPEGPAADVPLDLAKNIGVDVAGGLLGAAGGAALGTAATRTRDFLARQLADIGKEADLARVATAGPKAVKAAKKGVGGVDVKEMARVMRETEIKGSPKAIAEKSAAVREEAGDLIGRIMKDVDEASGGFMKKAQEARAQAAQMSEQIDSLVAQKQATADEARRLATIAADKLERARENQMQASMRGPKRMTRDQAARILASGATEDMDPAIIAEAKGVLSAPAGAPTPSAGADYNKYLAGLKADADEALKKADEASREVIAARNTDEAKVIADLNKQADELQAQATKRSVSGKAVGERIRREAALILSEKGYATAEQADPLTAKIHKGLTDYAEKAEASESIPLSAVNERLKPLAKLAGFEKGAKDVDVPAGAQAARETSRAYREGMDIAADEAILPDSPAAMERLARVGRGEAITEPPGGKQAYQSARRVYDVMMDVGPSAEERAAQLSEMSFPSRMRAQFDPFATGSRTQAAVREKAQTMAPKMGSALLSPQERMLASLPYGAESFADMIRRIDEEATQ